MVLAAASQVFRRVSASKNFCVFPAATKKRAWRSTAYAIAAASDHLCAGISTSRMRLPTATANALVSTVSRTSSSCRVVYHVDQLPDGSFAGMESQGTLSFTNAAYSRRAITAACRDFDATALAVARRTAATTASTSLGLSLERSIASRFAARETAQMTSAHVSSFEAAPNSGRSFGSCSRVTRIRCMGTVSLTMASMQARASAR
mmetsp:Transcript_10206/g.31496  ORF Transcript_10206/g.31496 Transcript_10206/m.31496 type:complete len:205 (+) Transcript_10206:3586-4200(+)